MTQKAFRRFKTQRYLSCWAFMLGPNRKHEISRVLFCTALHRYRRGQGSNPGKPENFFSFRNCILSCIFNSRVMIFPVFISLSRSWNIRNSYIHKLFSHQSRHHYHYYYCPSTWSYENQVSKHFVIFLNLPCLKFVYCVVCLCLFCFWLVL